MALIKIISNFYKGVYSSIVNSFLRNAKHYWVCVPQFILVIFFVTACWPDETPRVIENKGSFIVATNFGSRVAGWLNEEEILIEGVGGLRVVSLSSSRIRPIDNSNNIWDAKIVGDFIYYQHNIDNPLNRNLTYGSVYRINTRGVNNLPEKILDSVYSFAVSASEKKVASVKSKKEGSIIIENIDGSYFKSIPVPFGVQNMPLLFSIDDNQIVFENRTKLYPQFGSQVLNLEISTGEIKELDLGSDVSISTFQLKDYRWDKDRFSLIYSAYDEDAKGIGYKIIYRSITDNIVVKAGTTNDPFENIHLSPASLKLAYWTSECLEYENSSLVFSSCKTEIRKLWTYDIATNTRKLLAQVKNINTKTFSFSPSGNRIAYIATSQTGTNSLIYVVDL